MSVWVGPTGEQVWALIEIFVFQMGQHRLPGLFGDFKPDRPARLPLPDCRAINAYAIGSNLLRQQADDITATQLAVDRQVEKREIAGSVGQLQSGANCPDMFGLQGWFLASQPSLVPGALSRRQERNEVRIFHDNNSCLLNRIIVNLWPVILTGTGHNGVLRNLVWPKESPLSEAKWTFHETTETGRY
jgi:hypothetical protein